MLRSIKYKAKGLTLFFSLIVIILIGPSCIDEYIPEITAYQNLLVVDGMITNGPGPYKIELSLSSDVNSPEFIPYKNCSVSVLNNHGEVINFTEISDGVYESGVNEQAGIIGDSYKIKILTPSGKHYESEFDELKQATTIDSVYAEVETKIDAVSGYEYFGYQFYVDTKDAIEDVTYYLWRLEQTYQYNSDFTIKYYFDGDLIPFIPTDSLYTCWLTEKVKNIFIQGTGNISDPNLVKYPLNYVSTETREISVRYSLLASQLTIGETAYRFWQDVYDQNAGEASLYTTQLFQIRGNIKNINDLEEPVLGYFTVAGIDKKRIFVDRPLENIPFNYSICEISEGDRDAFKYIRWTDKNTWPLYVCRDENFVTALPHQACLDCRQKGGTINKPDFWIDN